MKGPLASTRSGWPMGSPKGYRLTYPQPVIDRVAMAFHDLRDLYGVDDCWPWGAAKRSGNYPLVCGLSEAFPAHRVAWLAAGNELLPGMVVDHLCWYPPCVNPRHLRLATQAENARNLSPEAAARHRQGCSRVWPA